MAGRVQGGAPKLDLFDSYFRRADLDGDGRISGAEAVSFFQGSNLPKNVLAQVWNYADQNRTGFLGRAEFYNALRLVTVAQSKRELTSEIVKAALYTPASAKIPAPQINLPVITTPQTNSVGSTTPSQLAPTISSSQTPGPRALSPQFPNMGQQNNMSSTSQSVKPSQGFSPGSTFGSGLSTTGAQMGSDGRTSGALTHVGSQLTSRGMIPPAMQAGPSSGLGGSISSPPIRPPGPLGIMPSTTMGTEQKEPALANGSPPLAAGLVLGPGVPRSSVNQGSLNSVQRSQPQRVQSVPMPNQPNFIQRPPSGPGLPPPIPAASQPHQQWSKMSQSDVRKYAKVFVEVDTDKDGKITGEQARNLFLSWRLPREVLKQVWDLSDQDNDSMLSLREFCIALYLMERYREGRPLPRVLPNNIMPDMHLTSQPAGEKGSQHHSNGARPRPPGKPPLPVLSTQADEGSNSKQQKLKVPVLEKHLVDQLSEEEQKNLNSKFEEAIEANKKVEELEKEIKESREKIEFCHTKMQEIVLYKSRCDNRLNEITARVATDKREVEMLAMKYEEKYREKGDVASKLTLEEATFRDIQERKMELYRAIVKLEQDGGSGETFKSHVEQIQSNLEELVKSLNQRCKNYGLRGKPTTVLELPFGWQPGIQEGAADWDENWDKFEDEGFTFVKELTLDVQNVIAPSKTKTKVVKKEKSHNDGSEIDAETQMNPESVFKENVDPEDKVEVPNGKAGHVAENGSAHEENETVSAKSPVASPAAKSPREIPEDGFRENHVNQVVSGSSPRAKEVKSDHGGGGEPAWGSFDNNDDNESVWGSTAIRTSKVKDDLFGPGGFNLNPIKTGSLFDGDNVKKGSSVFADSVPSTPLFPPSYSPQKLNEVSDDHHAPTFSRFDSFRSTESGFQPSGTLTRFDSMSSSKDFDHGGGFPSFDDSDPFGSGPFGSSSMGGTQPHSEVDPFGGSSSFRVSLGSETPRSEVDPFGAGPFRSSFGGETPRVDSDPFGPSSFRSSFGSETARTESDSFGAGPFKSTFSSETPRGEMDSFGAGPFASSFGSETPRSEYEGFGSVGPFKSSFGSETPRSEWMGTETPRDSFGYGGPFRSSMGSETPRSDVDPFGSSGPFRSSFGDETPRRDSDPFGGSGPFKSSFASETPRGGTNNWSAF